MEKTSSLIVKLVKFGITGGVATVIDFAVLYLLKSVMGVNVYIAVVAAYFVSLTFHYYISMKYVFVAREDLSMTRKMVIFLITAVIGLGLNECIMWGCIEFAGMYYMVGKVLATGVVMVFNYLARHLLLE
ncbi:MAG: GtrA family protein [Hespellia sp.]|nr:GtrA family protein [Hespellia sp.]